MTYETPFEKALLAEARRTNHLLELLVLAQTPQRYAMGMPQDGDASSVTEEMAKAAGLTPLRQDEAESPELREARWKARAKEVGLEAAVNELVVEIDKGTVKLDLDALQPAATDVTPEKAAPRRRAQD